MDENETLKLLAEYEEGRNAGFDQGWTALIDQLQTEVADNPVLVADGLSEFLIHWLEQKRT